MTSRSIAVGLGVDVEEDDVGTALHRALDIGQQHGVLDLLLVEELGRPLELVPSCGFTASMFSNR